MGDGNYDREAHVALTSARASLPREEVFRERGLNKEMNPYGVKYRESRDSKNHPNSIGIMFGLDETGSMSSLPATLAQETLPHFMEVLEKCSVVEDPQILFMGIGDARNDSREDAPFQLGQFESEEKLMDKCLTSINLEGKGGGNTGESYDLALYAAARKTSMDCWEKRGRKGYLFITGDEPPFSEVSARDVREVFGDEIEADIPLAEIVEEVRQTFNPFFLIPDLHRRRNCESSWRPVLGDNVICLETPDDTCVVSAVLIGLTEGVFENLDAASQALKKMGTEKSQINRVIRAVEPYAASLDRGGKVRPASAAEFPSGQGKSGNRRR